MGSCTMTMSFIMATAILLTAASTADILCYCNSAACADAGSKCRSQLGRCFSKMRYNPQPGDADDSINGCVESLAVHDRTSCLSSGRGDVITRKTNDASNALPILMCCTADMCNYFDHVDRPHVTIDVFTPNQSRRESSQANGVYPGSVSNDYYSTQEVWFKAAMIAVPIAGVVILIILVLLAVRMLRYDSRRQYEIKRNQSLVKAQLYVADHFSHFYHPPESQEHTEKTCLQVEKDNDEGGTLYHTLSHTHSATCLPTCQQCGLNCTEGDKQEGTRPASYTSLTHENIQNIGDDRRCCKKPKTLSPCEDYKKPCCVVHKHNDYSCLCDKQDPRDTSRDYTASSHDHEHQRSRDHSEMSQAMDEEQVTDILLQSQDIV